MGVKYQFYIEMKGCRALVIMDHDSLTVVRGIEIEVEIKARCKVIV